MSDISAEWKELRSKIGDFTSHMNSTNAQIDARLKKLQEKEEQQADLQAKIDEAYNKGMQDLYDALRIFSEPIPEMQEIFGSVYIEKFILNYSPEDIIDKVNEWKTEKDKKEQELRVGDEIEYARSKSRFEKRIIIGIEDGMDDDEKIIWSIDVELTGHRFWFCSTDKDVEYRKTGKHYDAIPFPKEI